MENKPHNDSGDTSIVSINGIPIREWGIARGIYPPGESPEDEPPDEFEQALADVHPDE